MTEGILTPFLEDGFCIVADAVGVGVVEELINELERLSDARGPGVRNLAALVPAVGNLARSPEVARVLDGLGVEGAMLVRSILFDKQAGSNWKVPWHQDLTIAVREKREVEGFGPWTEKGGIPHAQASVQVLEKMVTLRLHLDDCDVENGALRVMRGSHHAGVLTGEMIARWRGENREVVCPVKRGGILAMRPLLLHASSMAERPRHRRVVHLEFATEELPGGLEWGVG